MFGVASHLVCRGRNESRRPPVAALPVAPHTSLSRVSIQLSRPAHSCSPTPTALLKAYRICLRRALDGGHGGGRSGAVGSDRRGSVGSVGGVGSRVSGRACHRDTHNLDRGSSTRTRGTPVTLHGTLTVYRGLPCAHDVVEDEEVDSEAVAHVGDRYHVGTHHAGPFFEWRRPCAHEHTDQSNCLRKASAAVRRPGGGL